MKSQMMVSSRPPDLDPRHPLDTALLSLISLYPQIRSNTAAGLDHITFTSAAMTLAQAGIDTLRSRRK